MVLLFLLSFSGSIGPTWGYYSPSLDSLNSWLYHRDPQQRQLRTTSVVVGATARVKIMRFVAVEGGADYYKGNSPDGARSLSLIPAEVYLDYKHTLLPTFLYTYVGVGAGMCFTEYKDSENKESTFSLVGPVVKIGIEFTLTPRLGIEISGGWRFLKVPDIELKEFETGNFVPIPINLNGGYLRVTIERLLK